MDGVYVIIIISIIIRELYFEGTKHFESNTQYKYVMFVHVV